MFSGQPFPAAVTSMNAYYGAGPVVRALDMGAEIIITGQSPRHGGGNNHHRSGPQTWGRKLSSQVRALDMGSEIIITGQGLRHGGGNNHQRSGPFDMGAEIIITCQGPRHGGGNYQRRSGPQTWGRLSHSSLISATLKLLLFFSLLSAIFDTSDASLVGLNFHWLQQTYSYYHYAVLFL